MIGGNCTCVPGMVGGLKQGLGQMTKIGLVWIDAHGDFNTPKTQADGLLGAMPVSTVAGFCLPAWRKGAGIEVPLTTDQIVMVDVRHLGEQEAVVVEASDITVVGIDSRISARRSTGSPTRPISSTCTSTSTSSTGS